MKVHKWIFLILWVILLGLRPTSAVQAESIEVTTTADTLDADINCASIIPDDLPGDDGVTSLREAICAANNNGVPDVITFKIPCWLHCTITPSIALPVIIDENTTINGGAIPATETTPAEYTILLDGSEVENHNGLTIASPNNTIKGLVIYGFGINGIAIAGQYATDNVIAGNHIGNNPYSPSSEGNGFVGVSISLGSSDNTIGGDTPAERNVISDNGQDGVLIHGQNSTGNIISGNYIGTSPTGSAADGNTEHGVRIYGEAHDNTVGGETSGHRNIISGNGVDGVHIYNADDNLVVGNYIGTDRSGTLELGNGANGVMVGSYAGDNTIRDNLISDNVHSGVAVTGANADGNTIASNYIGTDASGSSPVGHSLYGIIIDAENNTIGGEDQSDGNLITSSNVGILLVHPGANVTVIQYNAIGTDTNKNPALRNTQDGIRYGDYLVSEGDPAELKAPTPQSPAGEDARPEAFATYIAYNQIAGNVGDGIALQYSSLHYIQQNSIFNNDMGISLEPLVNEDIQPPVITGTGSGSVIIQGTACAGCLVEVFENHDDDGEGETYIGSATADTSGAWELEVSHLNHPYLTATATDDDFVGTSAFSDVFKATYLGDFPVYLPVIYQP
jgi:hypothetical protein